VSNARLSDIYGKITTDEAPSCDGQLLLVQGRSEYLTIDV